jgi:SAM-dependent methyltransferase
MGSSRWDSAAAPRGDDYDDARWRHLAESGAGIHGEADLVDSLVAEHGCSRAVLDAGCGTGRVAIELARRDHDVVGVDLDAAMLDHARAKAPALSWVDDDLSRLDLGRRFGAVVLAGNVMIFVAEGTEVRVIERLAAHLEPGGLLIAGFQLPRAELSRARLSRAPRVGPFDLDAYDAAADRCGLAFVARYATWERAPYAGGDYAVTVHRTP